MQKSNPSREGEWRVIIFGLLALVIITADQVSKWWIRSNLAVGETLFDWGFFRIIHIYNTGAAFGILKDQTLLLSIIAFAGILLLLIVGFVLRRQWPFLNSLLTMSAIGLVLGGTIGNLADRLVRDGRVTDFLDFKVWPAFNIADMAINVGIVLIIIGLIRMIRRGEV